MKKWYKDQKIRRTVSEVSAITALLISIISAVLKL